VRTQVQLASGKNLSVDYAFRKTSSGEWKAYDVIIEGISYITNYRNQVDAEIQKEGIDGLIKRLQTQGAAAINEMKKESGGH
jgi:phospholipid transport system substrate-binding protein